jgi:hypothetical protein
MMLANVERERISKSYVWSMSYVESSHNEDAVIQPTYGPPLAIKWSYGLCVIANATEKEKLAQGETLQSSNE